MFKCAEHVTTELQEQESHVWSYCENTQHINSSMFLYKQKDSEQKYKWKDGVSVQVIQPRQNKLNWNSKRQSPF